MNIAIDAAPLLVRSAGVKNYLYYWIAHLRRMAGRETIRTVPALARWGELDHNRSIAGPLRTWSGLGALALSNYTPLPVMELAARGADVFHASVLTRRPPRGVKLTATVHDVTAWMMPELHPSANKRAEASFAELARRADGLIAVSQATKDDAVRVLGLDPNRVDVIHSGVAEAFFEAPRGDVRGKYGLARPFVLYIGTIEPRKNIGTLVDAWESLPRDLRDEHELVVAGPMGWADADMKEKVGRTRYLGYVPEADLAPLTAAATVFAYPSLYEGFGFPVAQAMAAGTAVVTSNVSSLLEVAGDAALLVDPRSVSELGGAIGRLLGSEGLRTELAARGRARAEGFRWPVCAARSLEFFRRVVG